MQKILRIAYKEMFSKYLLILLCRVFQKLQNTDDQVEPRRARDRVYVDTKT